ncbi:hypothetical protein KVR01_004011 [Diaporthe batatas]|uniref:uncharacterized protein n=1 Tax=Diaporthe batatas TaxID=748121 RepID=UPI001D0378E8|nr:uncharacterized protein KVR01_004011 [Diaporthe batatas]KAG8165459.1 hypothetical protein KVR01_004011 [Diaporthe batatas]
MDRLAIRRIAALPRPMAARSMIPQRPRSHARLISMQPRVAETSFWKSLIPKPLRSENRTGSEGASSPAKTKKAKSKDWNPATFYIVIFLLIGSMSIQMISLRKNFDAFMRRSDVRIGLLREVIERVQNGEKVDVEKVLGTGDREREAEWEEVLKEIERDSASRSQKKQDKAKTPAPSPPAAKAAPVAEPVPAQEPAKGRTAYFF